MLRAGDRAPPFTLSDQTGRNVTLRSLLASGPTVLFFYPPDFTPACTCEVCMVRDLHAELVAAGIDIVGISTDDVANHARFHKRHQLSYRLLADPLVGTIRAYGVAGPLGARRATFLIDCNRVIVDAVSALLRIGRHEAFLRRAVAGRATAVSLAR